MHQEYVWILKNRDMLEKACGYSWSWCWHQRPLSTRILRKAARPSRLPVHFIGTGSYHQTVALLFSLLEPLGNISCVKLQCSCWCKTFLNATMNLLYNVSLELDAAGQASASTSSVDSGSATCWNSRFLSFCECLCR